MTVYVDSAGLPFGRMIMHHMLADTPAELRAMAAHIGVDARWFQSRTSAPHFDICKSKRARAVASGAREIDKYELVEVLKAVRASWPTEARGGRRIWLLPETALMRPAILELT